jgi:CYTH domain-containing protein
MSTEQKTEIERKFLVRDMPELSGITPVRYERYYVRRDDTVEERVQKKGDVYEYERKEKISPLERTREKRTVSVEEFLHLKKDAGECIIRDSYALDKNLSLKIYHGRFEGLVRAEIEFRSTEEALAYHPSHWMGKEITTSPLGKDSALLSLTDEEFHALLKHS